MYDKIYNSATGRWVKTNGKVGKQIINKMAGGASLSGILPAHDLNKDNSYLNNCDEFNPPPPRTPLHQWNTNDLEHFEKKWEKHCSNKCSSYPGPPPTKSPLHQWNSAQLEGFKKDWQNDCCDTFHAPPTRSPLHQWNTRDIEAFEKDWNEDCGNQTAGAGLRQAASHPDLYSMLTRYISENWSEGMAPLPKSKLHQWSSADHEGFKQDIVLSLFGTKEQFEAKINRDPNYTKGIYMIMTGLGIM